MHTHSTRKSRFIPCKSRHPLTRHLTTPLSPDPKRIQEQSNQPGRELLISFQSRKSLWLSSFRCMVVVPKALASSVPSVASSQYIRSVAVQIYSDFFTRELYPQTSKEQLHGLFRKVLPVTTEKTGSEKPCGIIGKFKAVKESFELHNLAGRALMLCQLGRTVAMASISILELNSA